MEVGHLGAGGGVRRLATIRGMAVQVMDMRIVCQRQSQDASSGLAHKTDCAEWRMARMSVVSIFRPCEKKHLFLRHFLSSFSTQAFPATFSHSNVSLSCSAFARGLRTWSLGLGAPWIHVMVRRAG